MKLVAITLLAFVAAAIANPIADSAVGPVSISNNNVGDIVTVEVSANALVSSNIEQNIITLLAALVNQQAISASASGSSNDLEHHDEAVQLPKINELVPPQLADAVKSFSQQ